MGDQGLKAPDLIYLRRLKCKSYNIQSFFTAYLHFYSHTGKSHFPVTFELPMSGFSVTVLFYGILSMSCLSPCLSLTCVASVSVRFRRKQRGTRVKDRAKNGISKRAGGGGEERKETLADKPGILKTTHLHWPVMPEFAHRHLMLSSTVIIDQ